MPPTCAPGVGNYEVASKTAGPCYGMGTEERMGFIQISNAPGPGNYEIQSTLQKNKS